MAVSEYEVPVGSGPTSGGPFVIMMPLCLDPFSRCDFEVGYQGDARTGNTFKLLPPSDWDRVIIVNRTDPSRAVDLHPAGNNPRQQQTD